MLPHMLFDFLLKSRPDEFWHRRTKAGLAMVEAHRAKPVSVTEIVDLWPCPIYQSDHLECRP
jgi:uncharacterized membrane protein (UPF0127 family)